MIHDAGWPSRAVNEALYSRRPGRTVLVGDSLGGYPVLVAAAQLGSEIAGVVAGSRTFAIRGLAGAVAGISLIPGMLIPGGAMRPLIYACANLTLRAIVARGVAPAMRNVTMRALFGHDVLADVRDSCSDYVHRRRDGRPDRVECCALFACSGGGTSDR